MNRTSKSLCLSLLLLLSCTLSFAQGFDLTKPADILSVTGRTVVQPFRPTPNAEDPRSDGSCWAYDFGNYEESAICSFSPNQCIDGCLAQEQRCVDAARSICGNADNTQDSCFETRGDACRRAYNSCANGCS